MMNIPPMMQRALTNMLQQRYGSKEQMIQEMKKQAGNHPVLKNAVSLMEKGDYQELEKLGMNVCKENKLNPIDMIQSFIQQGGIK